MAPVTGGPARSDTSQPNMLRDIQAVAGGETDFKKKHKLTESGENQMKKEYKSSKDALQEFNPFKLREQWTLINNFTPEETETLENCLGELKTNMKYYTSIFLTLALGFNYWQRQFVPRKFYAFSLAMSCFTGAIFGGVKTSWYFV